MTQEFHLCVTCIGHNTYQIQTGQVSDKMLLVEEVVEWDVEDWLIHVEQIITNVATLRDRYDLYANSIALGKQLYAALFTGKIKDSWNTAQHIAQQENVALLLSLEIATANLVSIPWELLYTKDCFLVSDPQIALRINRVQTPSSNGLAQMNWDSLIHKIQSEDESMLEIESADQEWEETFIDDDSDPAYAEDSAVVADIFSQLAASPASTPEKEVSTLSAHKTQMTTQQQVEPPQKILESSVFVALVVGPLMMAIVAIATLLWGHQQPRQIAVSFTPLGLSRLNHRNWQAVSTQELTAIAIARFHQGDFSTAQNLVEELLNRNELHNAKAALDAIPDAKTDTILYLRGRLAWQSSQVEQARHYWEDAVKQKPDSAKYHNALGFAYYAQDNLNQANDAWFQALYLANESPVKPVTSVNYSHSDNNELLTTYAGLALVLNQSAQNQPLNKQAKLVNEAVKLRKKVLAEQPANFQPQQLNRNWLWHQKAVADWRSLLLIKDQ
ncbi:tetratricopeptide repeat protein [Gloeocapsopsis dulcis]|uniref:tetratricopeptide repeat protein n=1 Tax=Gloeocapsopsis dulcis TaxID=2859516 RepID=UPI00101ADE30|nr:tetratricopeptide repeat protein [Gloeocapsopsis dulcis]WNN88849.1 tetratricopeptide repeat protein [Gloeocapsopsis dulcis]